MKPYTTNTLKAERLRDILRSIPGDLCVVSRDFNLAWWNQDPPQALESPVKCYKALFQQKTPCPGCPLHHPEKLEVTSAATIKVLKDTFLVKIAPFPFSTVDHVVIHQKITSLAQEWKHLETMHYTLPMGLLLCDHDFKITYVNRGFYRFFPFLPSPLAGRDFRLVVSRHVPPFPKKLLDLLFSLSNRKQSSDTFDLPYPIPRHIEIQAMSLEDIASPTPSGGFILLFQDRTEENMRRLLEKQQQAYSDMASLISSLFRTLEPPLKRMQELSGGETPQETSSPLREFHREVSHLLVNLESLKQFVVHKSEKKWGQINLNEVLQRVIKRFLPLLKEHNIKLKTQFTRHLKPIQGSRSVMEKCLQAVLSNALEAVESKMDQTGNPFIPRIEIITLMKGSVIELTIKDNGVGMEAKQLARVCHPNYTTKDPSCHAGMGLFLCDTLLRHMGGTLELSSVTGVGTKAVMRIPSIPSRTDGEKDISFVPRPPSNNRRKPNKAIFSTWNISLLGEKDATMRVIRKFLHNLGATIEEIHDVQSLQKMGALHGKNVVYILNVTGAKQAIPFLSVFREGHLLDKVLILAPEEILPTLKGRVKNTGVRLLKKPVPMESLVESLTSIMEAKGGAPV